MSVGLSLATPPSKELLPNELGKAKDGSNFWAPSAQMRDLKEAPNSYQPVPGLVNAAI